MPRIAAAIFLITLSLSSFCQQSLMNDELPAITRNSEEMWARCFREDEIIFKEKELVEWGYSNGFYLGYNRGTLRHNIGTYYFNGSGDTYFGCWKKDSRSGLGVSLRRGSLYIGFWKNDEQNGFGIKQWPKDKPLSRNGYKPILKYVGEYQNGKWHGPGIAYFTDGTYIAGLWNQSEIEKELNKLEVLESLGF